MNNLLPPVVLALLTACGLLPTHPQRSLAQVQPTALLVYNTSQSVHDDIDVQALPGSDCDGHLPISPAGIIVKPQGDSGSFYGTVTCTVLLYVTSYSQADACVAQISPSGLTVTDVEPQDTCTGGINGQGITSLTFAAGY